MWNTKTLKLINDSLLCNKNMNIGSFYISYTIVTGVVYTAFMYHIPV